MLIPGLFRNCDIPRGCSQTLATGDPTDRRGENPGGGTPAMADLAARISLLSTPDTDLLSAGGSVTPLGSAGPIAIQG